MTVTEGPQFVTTSAGRTTMAPPLSFSPPAAEQRLLTPDGAAVVAHGEVVRTETERVHRWAIDAVIVAAVGVAMVIVGLIALARAGIDRPLSTPVVSVLGYDHTAVLALAEVGAGVLLLLAAAARSRALAVIVGLAVAIGGVVAAVQTSSFVARWGIESEWAWILAAAGGVVVLASILIPRPTKRVERVYETHNEFDRA